MVIVINTTEGEGIFGQINTQSFNIQLGSPRCNCTWQFNCHRISIIRQRGGPYHSLSFIETYLEKEKKWKLISVVVVYVALYGMKLLVILGTLATVTVTIVNEQLEDLIQ